MKIVQPSVRLLHATPYPEHVIEAAGRICYQSDWKADPCQECKGLDDDFQATCVVCGGYGTSAASADAFTRKVLKRGHESVIEHVSAGFRVVTDRGVTHELVRHRIASFSQESTRYCDYAGGGQFGGELSFIEPPFPTHAELGHDAAARWLRVMADIESKYMSLRGEGVKPELARSVLPCSLKAEIAMTCNAREWRHFLRLRLSPRAHPQMRQVARLIADELLRWCPCLFEDVTNDGVAT